jgi:hypothetical protein
MDLMTALQDVRAFAREPITPEELKSVDECIRVIDRVVPRWFKGEPDQRAEPRFWPVDALTGETASCESSQLVRTRALLTFVFPNLPL